MEDKELFEALGKRMDALEKVINEFTDSYRKSEDEWNRGEFRKRNADKLGKFEAKLKALQGDDFDVFDSAYDELHSEDFADYDEADYVNKLVTVLQEQLDKIKEGLADEADEAEDKAEETETEAEDKAATEPEAATTVVIEPEADKAEADNEIAEFEAYLENHPEEGKKYRGK